MFNARLPLFAALGAAGCLFAGAGCVQKPVRSEILVIDPALCALGDTPAADAPSAAARAISYMFCIPNNALARSQVARIDPSVRFDDGPRARATCGSRAVLCIGSTGQRDFKAVLDRLAKLPYVKQISLCPFE